MTLFDGILIVLMGVWPVILVVCIVLCVLVYQRTRSAGWVGFVVVVAVVLLLPALVAFWM